MSIPLDNSIIDFGTITNIVNTLSTHEDVFTAFEQQVLLQATDTSTGSNNTSTPLSVTSVQMASVKYGAVVGNNNVPFGVTFSAPPVVLATVEYNNASSSLVAQVVTSNGSSSTASASTYDGASINIIDTAGKVKNGTSVILHVLAIGQR